jgi:PAS domain S-box-containing protein
LLFLITTAFTTLVVMSSVVSLDSNEPRRAASLLAGQNHILEIIAGHASLTEILTSLARLIEDHIEGLLCSVLLLDESGRLWHGAAPGLPEAYTNGIDGLQSGPKTGSCGTAAYRKESVIVTDILVDPLWDDYRDLATRYGLRASWSTPFFSRRGDVLGTFAMYFRIPRSPGPAESQLIDVATRLATIAVERHGHDVELRRAAESYRSLVENLNDIVFRLDREGNVTYITPAIERLVGYPANETVGRPFTRFVHPEDLVLVQENLTNTLAGNPAPCEFRALDQPGRVHWCRISSRTQVIENQVVGITGVIVDITAEKTTHEALHQALQKYRTIFEGAIVGIFQTEPGGHYTAANPALARMLGYDSAEELMASISDIPHQIYVDPQRREEFEFLVGRDGSVRNFECEVYRKNGSKMWVSVNARAVREDGRIIAYE